MGKLSYCFVCERRRSERSWHVLVGIFSSNRINYLFCVGLVVSLKTNLIRVNI